MFSTDGYGDAAQSALDKAQNAQIRANTAKEKIQQIADQLPEDKRKVDQIPYDIEEANHNVDKAQASGESGIVHIVWEGLVGGERGTFSREQI